MPHYEWMVGSEEVIGSFLVCRQLRASAITSHNSQTTCHQPTSVAPATELHREQTIPNSQGFFFGIDSESEMHNRYRCRRKFAH